jgi:flagellar protein FlaG
MAIQQVGNAVTAAALNLPGKAAPQGADAAPQPVQTPKVSAPPPQSAASSLEQVQQAMKQVAEMVQAQASNLQFSIDKETGITVVKVVDTQTQEVIRQIPAQEMIDIAHSIEKAQGLLVQQKA